jgi:hypothetical protein
MYRALTRGQATVNYVKASLLDELDRRMQKNKSGTFALDDGGILKMYAEQIEGLSLIRDGATGFVANGLSTVVFGWSDAEGFLPLDHLFWTAKELMGAAYFTKQQLAQQLIMRYEELVRKYGITMDGLYATLDMILFLIEHTIPFTMKMHANRVVEHQGIKKQLKQHPALKLTRNSRGKTIQVTWHGISLFVTVEKIKNDDQSIIYRYLMSNKNRTAKDHILIYWLRWLIEEFFRTSKQKLGLAHCQSREIETQNAHIFNVFYAYAKLQPKSVELGFDSVDAFIKYLRITKSKNHHDPIAASDQIFTCCA